MNDLNAVPPAVQFVALGVLGVVLGSLINAGIYALAWFPRPISPWQKPHPDAPPRQRSDLAPILGWWGLRRETPIHGSGFWVRPLLLEIACGLGLPALYYWEVFAKGLAPPLAIPGFVAATPNMLHEAFVSHAILICLMLVATFIDFDEKTIPDAITVPGTLAGLLLAVIWPDSHLPVARTIDASMAILGYAPLLLTSNEAWPAWLDNKDGATAGVAIFVGWCVALIPALCTLRRGWRKAVQFYFASIARDSVWWKLLVLAAVGSAGIFAVWRGDGERWQALMTSLVGLAFGGGMIWAVRIAGRIALHKEAMGFGDVTLMAMIGAFLGWQPCLIIFGLSPFVALFIALAQWALTGRRDIPYGPYLCATTLVLIVQWPAFWNYFAGWFALGWLLPAILAACMLLMMGLLMAWRIIEGFFFGRE